MMKKIFAILSVFVLFLSCKTTQTGSGGLKVREYEYAYQKMVFDDYRFKFEFHVTSLEGDKRIEGIIKDLIYNGRSPDAYAEYKEKTVLEDLAKEGRPPQAGGNGENLREGEYIESVGIKNYGDFFAILRRDEYTYYSGQAHGNPQTQYYVVDLDEARILSPGELSSAIPEDAVKESIASKFNIDFNYREFVWPPDTISLEREGLLLFWNVYSIAPYSEGPIEITIPYSRANSYLTEKAKLIRDRLTN
jgi:hypothetical protein